MKQAIWAAGVLCCGLVFLSPTTAFASQCDVVYGDAGNNTIIVGENAGYFYSSGKLVYYRLGDVSVCWQNQSGAWSFASTSGCDQYSTSSDYLYVDAGAGDDRLAANSVNHRCVAADFASYVFSFDAARFDFHFVASMGTGSDHAYGTDNGDTMYSNKYGTIWNYLPADQSEDIICGYGGNDALYGDHDDTDQYEEILHGGDGTDDYCNGGADGPTYDWVHTTCNTHVAGYLTSTDWGNCGSVPPNLWW